MAGLEITKKAASEPITLTQAKAQCRIDESDTLDDVYLMGLIAAARETAELHTARSYVFRSYREYFDCFPGHRFPLFSGVIYDHPARHESSDRHKDFFELSRSPLRTVAQIQYLDTDGSIQTLDPDLYIVAPHREPAKIHHAPNIFWPPTKREVDSVWIDYTCGYGEFVEVTTQANSKVLSGALFSADDVDLSISIPGAADGAKTLKTTIASVDNSGTATLTDAVSLAVSSVASWVGGDLPAIAQAAMLLLITHWYETRTPVQSGSSAEVDYTVKHLLGLNGVHYQP